ncbi:CRISPR system precrRNA processing endoribonuclease RAMP protein Cas6 [Thermosulfuriphilus sp.]
MFSGVLDEFVPLLRIGEQVQVGKNTAFGFGAYKLDLS